MNFENGHFLKTLKTQDRMDILPNNFKGILLEYTGIVPTSVVEIEDIKSHGWSN